MPFCTGCGAPSDNTQRFCSHCGIPLASLIPPVPQYPQTYGISPPPTQKVITVIGQVKKPRFGLADSFTMVFTSQELILAKLSNQVLKTVISKSQAESKAAGKGWMGKVGDQMTAFYGAHLRYLDMEPDAIMAEDKSNFTISYCAVSSLCIKSKYSGSAEDGPGNPCLELEFDTGSEKVKFLTSDASKGTLAVFERFFGPVIKR